MTVLSAVKSDQFAKLILRQNSPPLTYTSSCWSSLALTDITSSLILKRLYPTNCNLLLLPPSQISNQVPCHKDLYRKSRAIIWVVQLRRYTRGRHNCVVVTIAFKLRNSQLYFQLSDSLSGLYIIDISSVFLRNTPMLPVVAKSIIHNTTAFLNDMDLR
jgi:hypothetical protein